MKTLLSTREVSALMNVTETTIKRWADADELPCVRTLGGHRKFTMNDVMKFAEIHSYPLTGVLTPNVDAGDRDTLEFSVQTRNYRKASELLLDEALRGEGERLIQLLSYFLKHGIPVSTAADEIIRPAMVEIGELWKSGKLEVNEEHLASHALLEAIIRLSPELHRKPSNNLTAVCACAEGEHHEIGLRLLAYVLESQGWTVKYLGVNTPFDTLRAYLKVAKPDLVCLSYTLSLPDKKFIEQVRSVGRLAHSLDAAFMVGGFFAGKFTPGDFLCEHISSSASDTVSYLRDRFQLKPGPKPKKPAEAEPA
ncbi:MAG TPA: cobalamin-dependent protein [Bacteroidota bacterium]|jgi:excisionase family DNA binding protein|nr:cobalamin-dependent protein [Bacteroidota bacterium]